MLLIWHLHPAEAQLVTVKCEDTVSLVLTGYAKFKAVVENSAYAHILSSMLLDLVEMRLQMACRL